jgi:uncharacterized protein YbjT (DUF2867 family)
VRRIVYLSVHQADKALTIPHVISKLPVEGVIRASGLEYTILRPNNFYQNDSSSAGCHPRGRLSGSFDQRRYEPRGRAGHRRSGCDRLDLAGPLRQDLFAGGSDGLDGREHCGVVLLTRHLGKPVMYVGDDLKAWAAQMRAFMPGWLVRDLGIGTRTTHTLSKPSM